MTETWTLDDYRERTRGTRSKYRNRRVVLDGYMFDSKAEAVRYRELRVLERTGAIRGLVVHPSYVLQKAFKHNGKRERAIRYEADFEYTDTHTGRRVVEDVKGKRTQAYAIKRKLFLARYGNEYEFREVDA